MTLIERHGPRHMIPVCSGRYRMTAPKRASTNAYDLCGVHRPELPALFMTCDGFATGGKIPCGLTDNHDFPWSLHR
jgi:hypothetical protein